MKKMVFRVSSFSEEGIPKQKMPERKKRVPKTASLKNDKKSSFRN
jgi:hypothetical protein